MGLHTKISWLISETPIAKHGNTRYENTRSCYIFSSILSLPEHIDAQPEGKLKEE